MNLVTMLSEGLEAKAPRVGWSFVRGAIKAAVESPEFQRDWKWGRKGA
jgi:hypothetical protein